MSEESKQENLDSENSSTLRFDYVKSNYYRVVHADGISGGITSNGNISISFWSELSSFPESIEYSFEAENEEATVEITQRDAFVREVEASLIVSSETAKIMIEWLKTQIDEIEEYELEMQEKEEDSKSLDIN
jgi:hypothetical protein